MPQKESEMSERMVQANGIEICTESFGNPADPALLVIQGANASMLRSEEGLCQALADGGLYVIRFDNRDTGRSTAFTPYHPPYDLVDMAHDAAGLLGACGIERAHVLGLSSGGMIAQLVAIHHPDRALSLVPIMSTPEVPEAAHAVAGTTGAAAPDRLPMPTPGVFDLIRFLAAVDWSDAESAADAWVMEAKALAGSRYPVDEEHARELGRQEVRRARNLLSLRFNHPLAEHRTAPWRHRLSDLRLPALVIHGTEDPVLPLAHGRALAAAIPGAALLELDGVGHELPHGAWATVVPAILAHVHGNPTR
jgi:pimeloyl-ACP methyl ester carboxylesterase